MSNSPPVIGDRFEVLNELGSGGMGIVYRARDRETGTIVAVKVLHPEIAGRRELIERFKTELVLARRITHKNICRVYDLNRFGNAVVISMEYIEGESLRARFDREQGISIRHGLQIIHQAIAGLEEAHAQGVIHRDLKPENILIARDGTVKVMDFGIARSVDTDATLTGAIMGTPTYMSPEQAEAKAVDLRSDIYSLGLVMYEMFCGQRAFTGDTPVAVAVKQIRESPPAPSEVDAHIPPFLDRAILKCIEKNPARRFQTLRDLKDALVAVPERVESDAVKDGPEPPLPLNLTGWQRDDWLLVVLAAIGLLLFFPFFNRTSLAPRKQVSFDRSVLVRIAQEHAQKLGAPIGGEAQTRVSALLDQYDFIARHGGTSAVLELANNPIPYTAWNVDWENGTSITVDDRGALVNFDRSFGPASFIEGSLTDSARLRAENAVRDFLNADLSTLHLEAAGNDVWRGLAVAEFTWLDAKQYYGLKRRYTVRLVGNDLASLETVYDVPPGYARSDLLWQMLTELALGLTLFAIGFSQRRLVNLWVRWRVVTLGIGCVVLGTMVWVVLPVFGSIPVTLRVLVSVITLLWFVVVGSLMMIPSELALRRAAPAKLAAFLRLFGRRVFSEPCGLGVLRGTLIAFFLLGVQALALWAGTRYLGMWRDSVLVGNAQVTLGNTWFNMVGHVFIGVYKAIHTGVYIPVLTYLAARLLPRRPRLAVLLAAASAAAFLSPMEVEAFIQPYPSKMLLLTLEYVILAWTLLRFDLLTLGVAAFTFAFCEQNYGMLVAFRPIGSVQEWTAFAVWGLFVLAAAAVAFKSSIMAAWHRIVSLGT